MEYGHTYYRILSEEDGTCEAVGHASTPNIYLYDSVPIRGKDYKLIHIADSAFIQKNYIKSVYIPDGLISIGKDAFRECNNITSINMPNSITTIDDRAFYACKKLSSLSLSTSIKRISRGAFTENKITTLIVPEGVTHIQLDAFGNCENL